MGREAAGSGEGGGGEGGAPLRKEKKRGGGGVKTGGKKGGEAARALPAFPCTGLGAASGRAQRALKMGCSAERPPGAAHPRGTGAAPPELFAAHFLFSIPFCSFFRSPSAPHFQPRLRLCKRRTSGERFSVGLARPYSFFPARSPLRAALLVAPWAQRHRVNGTQRFVPCSLRPPISGGQDARCAAFTSFPAKGDPFVPLSGSEWQREGPARSCRITSPTGVIRKLVLPNSIPPAAPWGPSLQCRGARQAPTCCARGPSVP